MSSNPFRRLADWELRHRGGIFLGLILVTAGALALLPGLEFDFRPEALLEFSAEEREFAREFQARFGVHENLLLVVLQGDAQGAVTNVDGLTLLYRLTEAASESEISLETVSLVRVPRRDLASGLTALTLGRLPPLINGLPITPADATRVKAQIATSRMLPNQLISVDGSTTVIVIAIQDAYQDHDRLDQPLADLEAQLAKIVRESKSQFELHFAGLPFVRLETVRSLKREQLIFWPITAVLYLSLMWLLYRNAVLAVAPLMAVGLASLWGIALLPLVGSRVNVVNNIVPTLILVIGVCNAVHMLHAFVHARNRGRDGPGAARQMMAALGLPVFLTSLTTAIGFASLMVARNGTLRDLGWQASAGIMMSYLALITFLPVVVARLGDKDEQKRTRPDKLQDTVETLLDKVATALMRYPRRALAGALAVVILALVSGLRVPVDSRVLDTFPPGSTIFESNQLVEQKLGGILPLEIQLEPPSEGYFTQAESLHHLFAIQQELAQLPGVLDVKSVVDLIAEVHSARSDDEVDRALTQQKVDFALSTLQQFQPEALALFLGTDRRATRIAARLADDGIRASLATLEKIDDATPRWLDTFDAPVTLRLTGEAYIASRGLNFFIRDLILSLMTAGAVIFLVLVTVFRSLRMGLLSFLPTVAPLALTLGLIPLYGYELNTSTVVVFTISIGMAVDNTIHLLTAFRRARLQGEPLEDAIRSTFRHSGVAVVASNLLLIGGFAVLFLSNFEPVFRVAALTTTTIGAAMLAAVLILPQLLVLWGGAIGNQPVIRQNPDSTGL